MTTTPEDVSNFLEQECFTTEKEKDPTKPFILKKGVVMPNPNYDKNAKPKIGTSFFVNFDKDCDLHLLPGLFGEPIRRKIGLAMHLRFIKVLAAQFPKEPSPPMGRFIEILRTAVSSEKQPGFNNGEVYLWLPHNQLKEDFVFEILKALKTSLDDDPIKIDVEGEEREVKFCGWGFRYV